MGLFLKQQEDQRSQLQEKIAAQLKERQESARNVKAAKPDPAFLENQETTKGIGIIIAVVVLLLIALVVWLLAP